MTLCIQMGDHQKENSNHNFVDSWKKRFSFTNQCDKVIPNDDGEDASNMELIELKIHIGIAIGELCHIMMTMWQITLFLNKQHYQMRKDSNTVYLDLLFKSQVIF